jgi:hypothetical protein
VSGAGKPVVVSGSQHAADAEAAALALAEILEDGEPGTDVECAPESALNLAAAMALWAGFDVQPAELHMELLVVRVKPVPTG